MLSSRKAFTVLGMILLVHSAASALTINATFTNSAGQTWDATRQTVVNTAIAEWEYVFSNVNQTIDVEFDFTNAGTGGYLGQWDGTWGSTAYSTGPTTPIRPWNTDTLNSGSGTGATITVTQKIHINADLLTGANYLWFDPTPSTGDDIPFAAWDALSVMRHEICHMMGFTDSFYKADYYVSDSFDWDAQITGTTFDASGLNLSLAAADNLGHFLDSGSTAGDLMVPLLTNNERRDISYNDVASLEVAYGYDLVPEPASLSLLGFGAIALLRRRRNG